MPYSHILFQVEESGIGLLTVNRQVLHWYALDDTTPYGPDAPVFIWMHGPRDVDYVPIDQRD